MTRWKIWKHDCIKHGMGDGIPCRPRCDDPWQADDPQAVMGNTFATFEEAIRWADKMGKETRMSRMTAPTTNHHAPDTSGAFLCQEEK